MLTAEGVFAAAPGLINCQGRITVNSTSFTGSGEFRFALIDGVSSATLWSNGTASVLIPVDHGNYSVLLGDTSVANMNGPIPASVFAGSDVRLRVWFNDGVSGLQALSPDQRFGSVPYAMNAGGSSSTANSILIVNSLGTTTLVANALQNATGAKLTVMGDRAGAKLTSGTEQTLYGVDSGANIKDLSYNSAFGVGSLQTSSNGCVNTAIGHYAINALSDGNYNAAMGAGAMKQTVSGSYNTALGANAMMSWSNGSDNVAIGGGTLRLGNGSENTAVGSGAAYHAWGNCNTFLGRNAGNNTANFGSYNMALGYNAGTSLTTGKGNILLGTSAGPSTGAASNEFVAGSASYPAANVYFGKGAANASPSSYAIRGTASTSVGVAGGDLRLVGGLASGTARGGAVSLEAAPAGAGTVSQTLLMVVDGTVVMPNLPTSTNGLSRSGSLWNNNGVLSVWTK